MQFGALRSEFAIDHFRARVIAFDSAACRVRPDHRFSRPVRGNQIMRARCRAPPVVRPS